MTAPIHRLTEPCASKAFDEHVEFMALQFNGRCRVKNSQIDVWSDQWGVIIYDRLPGSRDAVLLESVKIIFCVCLPFHDAVPCFCANRYSTSKQTELAASS